MEKIQQMGTWVCLLIRPPVCYLGKMISYIPMAKDLGEGIQREPLLALVCIVAAVVFSIIFYQSACSFGVLIGGYYLGVAGENRWLYEIKQFCLWMDQNYSPFLVMVTLCALVFASQYLIVSSCVNGSIGMIRGIGLNDDEGKEIFRI